jgi:hypothetical protein
MADAGRMIFLGFGKYARADKIYAVEPIVGNERGEATGRASGSKASPTRSSPAAPSARSSTTWARTPRSAHRSSMRRSKLAERIVEDADKGRVDLNDLSRRARRLLEKTSSPGDEEKLF